MEGGLHNCVFQSKVHQIHVWILQLKALLYAYQKKGMGRNFLVLLRLPESNRADSTELIWMKLIVAGKHWILLRNFYFGLTWFILWVTLLAQINILLCFELDLDETLCTTSVIWVLYVNVCALWFILRVISFKGLNWLLCYFWVLWKILMKCNSFIHFILRAKIHFCHVMLSMST